MVARLWSRGNHHRIESDCAQVVSAIRSNKGDQSECGVIIEQYCRSILQSLANYSVCFVR